MIHPCYTGDVKPALPPPLARIADWLEAPEAQPDDDAEVLDRMFNLAEQAQPADLQPS